jgi:hypothetical protein
MSEKEAVGAGEGLMVGTAVGAGAAIRLQAVIPSRMRREICLITPWAFSCS